MNAEYRKEAGCPQRNSAEHEEYVGAQSAGSQEVKEQDGADLLERNIHPCPRKVLEGSQSQAERADFPEPGQKCPSRDAEGKSLHTGLAGLLRNCKHKDNHAELGWVAEKKTSLLYLEAVEESQNESQEPGEAGNAAVAG